VVFGGGGQDLDSDEHKMLGVAPMLTCSGLVNHHRGPVGFMAWGGLSVSG